MHTFARLERERRFLLDRLPDNVQFQVLRHISDRYIEGTRLRLRKQHEEGNAPIFKLTQKVSAPGSGAQQGLITTIYLTEDEYFVFAQFPAKTLEKTRYSVPPFGIDVFEGSLKELILAEAEFESEAEANALRLPSFIAHEISTDMRFTGGQLVLASRHDLQEWIAEYGLEFRAPY